MDNQNDYNKTGEKHVFREILYVLKKNLILLLIITFLVTAVGGVYSFLRKPKYVATEQLLFSMGDRADIAGDMNTMNAYKATIQSFANQGVVVDRANYYAKLYYTADVPTQAEFEQMKQDAKNDGIYAFPESLTYESYKEILLDLLVFEIEAFEYIVLSYNEEIAIWDKVIEKLEDYAEMKNGVADPVALDDNDQARKILHQQAVVLSEMRILSDMIHGYDMQELLYRQAIKNGTDKTKVDKDKQTLAKLKAEQEIVKNLFNEDQKTLSKLLERQAEYINGFPFRYDSQDTVKKVYEALGRALPTPTPSEDSQKFLMYGSVSQAESVRSNVVGERDAGIANSDGLIYDAKSEEGKANAGKQTYIKSGSIGILATDTEEKSFIFGISYTDGVEKLAKEKVKLLTLAYDIESSYFFTNLKANIDDLGLKSCQADMSKTTIMLIAFCIGIVLALIVVYLLYVLDKTIKSREDAEKIAGCPVLACIEPQEVKSNG